MSTQRKRAAAPVLTPATPRRTGAIAALSLAVAACGSDDGPRPTKTVVVISLDTLRPDRLGVYGGAPGVSPVLDALAREAAVFDNAHAPSSWTLPSHVSLFTGLDPVAHGVRTSEDQLPDAADTLAERLGRAGFRTAAFTDGGFVGPGWGMEQGFELYDAAREENGRHGFDRHLDSALAWMAERRDEPYFLFLHTYDVHAPYDECDPAVQATFRARPAKDGPLDFKLFQAGHTRVQRELRISEYGRMEELLRDYDAGIAEADLGVGRVLDALRESGRYDDALVIVLSDHGESFFDSGLWVGHGLGLRDEELRVPLIVKFSRGEFAGARCAELVDLLDVLPTVCESAGVPIDPKRGVRVQGESLVGALRGAKRARSLVFGSTANTESYVLVRGGFKYITPVGLWPMAAIRSHIQPQTPESVRSLFGGSEFQDGAGPTTVYSERFDPLGLLDGLPPGAQLYDRTADPRERVNLAASQPARVAEMNAAVLKLIAESERIAGELRTDATKRVLTPNEVKQLAQLGYLAAPSKDSFAELPNEFKQMLNEPHVAPDCSALDEADREVHKVRLALREKRALAADAGQRLDAAGAAYASWATANPKFFARSEWRLFELRTVASGAGLELAAFDEWKRTIEAAFKAAQR